MESDEMNRNMLIIDKDQELCDRLSYKAIESGYFPISTQNIEDGIKKIEKNKDSLKVVITDITFACENGSGYDILEYINEHEYPIKVIAMSVVMNQKKIGALKSLGVYDTIQKSFEDKMFIEKIQSAMNNS